MTAYILTYQSCIHSAQFSVLTVLHWWSKHDYSHPDERLLWSESLELSSLPNNRWLPCSRRRCNSAQRMAGLVQQLRDPSYNLYKNKPKQMRNKSKCTCSFTLFFCVDQIHIIWINNILWSFFYKFSSNFQTSIAATTFSYYGNQHPQVIVLRLMSETFCFLKLKVENILATNY